MSSVEAIVYPRANHESAQQKVANRLEQTRLYIAAAAAKLAADYVEVKLPAKKLERATLPPAHEFLPTFNCSIPAPREGAGDSYAEFEAVGERRRGYTAYLKAVEGRDEDYVTRHEYVFSEGATNLARHADGGTVAIMRGRDEEKPGSVLVFINAAKRATPHAVPRADDEHGRGEDVLGFFTSEHGICYATKQEFNNNVREATDIVAIGLQTEPSPGATEARWYFIPDAQPAPDLSAFGDL